MDWAGYVSAMDNFTDTVHHNITPPIDPTTNTLLQDFIVCIIGASSGIGEAIAYAYAKAHASGIILASRRRPELESVATNTRTLNPKARVSVIECDITSPASVSALSEHVKSEFGRLDVLISNPGYAGPVTLKLTNGDPAWFQQNFDVNIIGTYNAAHYFIPLLLSTPNGARSFISIGSIAACILGGPIANTGYCISKMAQSRLIEHLAYQFADQDLLAINVHPGAVATPMAEGNTPKEFLSYLVDDVNLCGGFCVWLTKDAEKKRWLTGRFISACWDVDELIGRQQEIIEKDLLRWTVRTKI